MCLISVNREVLAVIRARLAVLFCVLLISGLVACGGEPATPEERVRAWLWAGETAAENGRLRVLMEMISARYKDGEGRNRRGVVQLLAGHFRRHRSIHVLTRIERIAFPTQGQAQVVLYAAMAASPIEGAQSLTNMRADLQRFELDLADEDGEWKLLSAAWRPASTQDFILLGRA
jgi:hypothetical protein